MEVQTMNHETEVKMAKIPPMGVPPHFVVHEERIYELSQAIARHIIFIGVGCTPKDRDFYFRSIMGWAKEIQCLAELELKMDGG
jgi:hypothetical protein